MYRTLVLVIVLTLGTGSTAAIFCDGWCDAENTTTACPHRNPAAPARIAADHGCADTLEVAVAIGEHVQRAPAAGASAVLVAAAPPVTNSTLTAVGAERILPTDKPLLIPLRI